MQAPSDNRLVLFVARGTEAIQLQEQLAAERANYDASKVAADQHYADHVAQINAQFTREVLRIIQQTESRLELLADHHDDDEYDDDDD